MTDKLTAVVMSDPERDESWNLALRALTAVVTLEERVLAPSESNPEIEAIRNAMGIAAAEGHQRCARVFWLPRPRIEFGTVDTDGTFELAAAFAMDKDWTQK